MAIQRLNQSAQMFFVIFVNSVNLDQILKFGILSLSQGENTCLAFIYISSVFRGTFQYQSISMWDNRQ